MSLVPGRASFASTTSISISFATPAGNFACLGALMPTGSVLVSFSYGPFTSVTGTTSGTVNFSDTVAGVFTFLLVDIP